jgi:hypothetical protein
MAKVHINDVQYGYSYYLAARKYKSPRHSDTTETVAIIDANDDFIGSRGKYLAEKLEDLPSWDNNRDCVFLKVVLYPGNIWRVREVFTYDDKALDF